MTTLPPTHNHTDHTGTTTTTTIQRLLRLDLADQPADRLTHLEPFLHALPDKAISEQAYLMLRHTLQTSLTHQGHVPPVLQLALLTYLQTCERHVAPEDYFSTD